MTEEDIQYPYGPPPDRKAGRKKARPAKRAIPKHMRPKRSLGRKLFLTALLAVIFLAICGGVGGVLVIYYFSQDLPPIDALKNFRPNTVTYFYSDDGRVVGEFFTEHRIVVPLAKVPQHVRNAFIAAEDASFYTHPGFDFLGIVRATLRLVETGEARQGASTITQQVCRSFLLTQEKKFSRKIKEIILAWQVTQNLSKDEVLYLYLNQVYMGHGAYGIESAAQLYYNKHVDQLTVAEAALVAGVLPAPSRYSPFVTPAAARTRQEYVIGQMVDNNFLTREEAKAALAEKLKFHDDRPNYNLAYTPYFTEHVRRVLEEKYGQDRLYKDGLKVHTTVNIEAYAAAEKAVAKGIREFNKRRNFAGPVKQLKPEEIKPFLAKQAQELGTGPLNPDDEMEAVVTVVDAKNSTLTVVVGDRAGTIRKKDLNWALKSQALAKLLKPGDVVRVRLADPEPPPKPDKNKPAVEEKKDNSLYFSLENDPMVQAALLSVDNRDGAVKAMIGGRDFKESQFNRAVQSMRQPGSSFKPIIYTAAMDNGYTPGSIIIDSPIVYDDFAHGRRWKPTNFDQKFYGPTDLFTGLTQSRNVMTIKLLAKVGYPAVVETARKLGITSELPNNLSLGLGSQGISMPEMVTAFSTFANMGERVDPMFITKVLDRDGNVLEEFTPKRIRAISSGTACTINYMLRGAVEQGTGSRVRALGRPAGGKTGTTNDLADAWFVGFTPEYTTGVWIGRDAMERMGYGESGGVAAAPIFLYYMQDVLKGRPVRDFEVPPDGQIVNSGSANICYKAGTVGTGLSEAAPQATPDEEFLKFDLDEKAL